MTKATSKLIGLSLSFCVRDLVEGKVAYEQVTKLITGTCAPDDKEWELLMKDYLAWYWWGTEGVKIRPADEKKAKAAIAIANRLRSEGKIEQPRHSTGMCPQWFHDGRWVRDESEIQWVKF